jgi:aryl-alcohol dehydrogenase (NADP+)
MNTVRLGSSGLEISAVILGMMSYGEPGRTREWTLDIDAGRPIVRAAWEAGITTFDTSNSYSVGASEEVTGVMLRELGSREDYQVLTKVYGRMRDGRNGGGLSRAGIMHEIDASLRRLGTDYVDVYQIHRFDPNAPIEETMQALDDVVRAGKARYIGASSMWAWQFATMQATAVQHGWTKFVSMQDQYNLLQREEEREMHPYCLATGFGVIPWSPLARGYAARPWDSASSARSSEDEIGHRLIEAEGESNHRIVDAIEAIAGERGVPMAQVALAWVMSKPAVSAPIVGATKLQHVTDAVAGAELELTDAEIARLEEHYTARPATGFV